MSDRELLRRVWDEYGMRGDLPAKLLMEIERALDIETYTCGCEVLDGVNYCPEHYKPVMVKKLKATDKV